MRRRQGVLLAACLAALLGVVPAAVPQEAPADGIATFYWPSRSFNFPIEAANLAKLNPKPTHLQLFHSLNRQPWQAGPKHGVNSLPDIGEGRTGFRFEATRDGEYEFRVQYTYADGSVTPRTDEMSPEKRVVIDTIPPSVRVIPAGNGVEWVATDDYLDPRSVTLECKWPTDTKWTKIEENTSGKPFKAADRYAWQLQPGKTLEVRVSAKDRAGNKGNSTIVRVPDTGAVGTGFPRPGGAGPDWLPPGGDPLKGPATGGLPQPRIDYVNNKDITIDYSLHKIPRSGIKAAHLYVQKPQANWEFVRTDKADVTPAEANPNIVLKYTATIEGTYGFYVIPESGAGQKADPPRPNDPPMIYVVVDVEKPHVKITDIQVRPGGVHGPVVEITWEAADQNLMPNPISLEYSLDRDAKSWQPIKLQTANNLTTTTGRYAWEVPDEKLWHFWVRIRATDKAANTGEFVTEKEVIVDLEKPAGGINKVRGGSAPPVGSGPGSLPPVPAGPGAPMGPGSPSGPPPVPSLPDMMSNKPGG